MLLLPWLLVAKRKKRLRRLLHLLLRRPLPHQLLRQLMPPHQLLQRLTLLHQRQQQPNLLKRKPRSNSGDQKKTTFGWFFFDASSAEGEVLTGAVHLE